jgi:hypothetical protein
MASKTSAAWCPEFHPLCNDVFAFGGGGVAGRCELPAKRHHSWDRCYQSATKRPSCLDPLVVSGPWWRRRAPTRSLQTPTAVAVRPGSGTRSSCRTPSSTARRIARISSASRARWSRSEGRGHLLGTRMPPVATRRSTRYRPPTSTPGTSFASPSCEWGVRRGECVVLPMALLRTAVMRRGARAKSRYPRPRVVGQNGERGNRPRRLRRATTALSLR